MMGDGVDLVLLQGDVKAAVVELDVDVGLGLLVQAGPARRIDGAVFAVRSGDGSVLRVHGRSSSCTDRCWRKLVQRVCQRPFPVPRGDAMRAADGYRLAH